LPAPPVPAPSSASAPPSPREAQVRRRRLGAGIVLVALVVLLAVVLSSSGGHAGASQPRARARALVPPPKLPESDEAQAARAAVPSVLAYTPFVREGSGSSRDVALTFDDGPGPYTPGVLDVLERLHARATFFAIGRMLRYFGASTEREIRDGDVIGDHTENHPMLARLSAHDQREELFEAIARIEFLGAPRANLFRPPYGSFNAATFRLLHALGLLMVLWSVDTNDYTQPGVSVIVERALAGAHPGAIILMHDGGGNREQTIAALPAIVRGLRARHLNVVTVPQLLADEPPRAGQPLPTSLAGD
ncbi:MAG TPA: polysaccharide deacetylase family protein, partial [Solirubrobacteraceae bacterium]|nr:polysaccharide deacetylase family protein [Solirubrobacteraceae bacterium]